MKKLFVTAIISMACVFGASAQRASSSSTSFFSTEKADQGVTWGIRGGLNLSNMKISDGSSSESADSKPGFNIGVSVDIPLLQSLYLQSGLYYTTKGYKYSEEYDREKDEVKVTPQYLELPISKHSIFRHDNFIGCFSADKIKMSVRKYFCFNIPIDKNMAEGLFCRSPYHEEYIQTSASGNPEGLYH